MFLIFTQPRSFGLCPERGMIAKRTTCRVWQVGRGLARGLLPQRPSPPAPDPHHFVAARSFAADDLPIRSLQEGLGVRLAPSRPVIPRTADQAQSLYEERLVDECPECTGTGKDATKKAA